MGYIGQTPTAVPLVAGDISDGIISEAKLAADAVSLAKMKAGTDGNIISYDASGNPVAIATGSSGQVLTSGGAGAAPSFAAGGKVLQVVSVTKTDVFSATNGTTWVDVTGLSVAITPSATSSKILVCWNVALGVSATSNNIYMRMLRGSTAISVGDAALTRNRSTGGSVLFSASAWVMVAGTYLDSPATTSATTYKAQLASQGSITKYVNNDGTGADIAYSVGRTASTITLMEVGA